MQKELLAYIKQQLQNGMNKEEIKIILLSHGWAEKEIVEIFKILDSKTAKFNPMLNPGKTQQISNTYYYVFFAILLFIAAMVGLVFNLKKNTLVANGAIQVKNKSLSQWKKIEQMGNQECQEIGIKGDKIFLSCENHLYKSFDGGKTWQADSFWDTLNSQPTQARIKLNDLPYHIVFDNSGNTVYAASPISGIYRSKDGGQNWEAVNNGVRTKFSQKNGLGVSALTISPSNNNVLYAVVSENTLIKSENMGDSWQIIQELSSINGLYVNTHDSNQIYLNFAPTIKSSDGGKTLEIGQDSLPTTSVIKTYFVDPNNFYRIIVGGLGGVFISTNGGSSWEALKESLQGKDFPKNISNSNAMNQLDMDTLNTIMNAEQKLIVSITIHPSDPNIIVVGTKYDGIISSKDGGKTWKEVNKGLVLQSKNQQEFTLVEKVKWSDDGSKLYLLSKRGVYILD